MEDCDRRLVAAYLGRLFTDALLDGPELCPGLRAPPQGAGHAAVVEYLRDTFPPEAPATLGLFPNAELGYRLREADAFCGQLAALQVCGMGGAVVGEGESMALHRTCRPSILYPRPTFPQNKNYIQNPATGGLGMHGTGGDAALVRAAVADVLDRLPQHVDVDAARSRVEEMTPLVAVALQEGETLNALLDEVRRGLAELGRGLAGELSMSDGMDGLARDLGAGRVPPAWVELAGPTLRGLDAWVAHLAARAAQLADWLADLAPPPSVWLPGLFNPKAFLAAVVQTVARANAWSLDGCVLLVEPARRGPDGAPLPPSPRDGALMHGLWMEGGRWDERAGVLEPPRGKELVAQAPVGGRGGWVVALEGQAGLRRLGRGGRGAASAATHPPTLTHPSYSSPWSFGPCPPSGANPPARTPAPCTRPRHASARACATCTCARACRPRAGRWRGRACFWTLCDERGWVGGRGEGARCRSGVWERGVGAGCGSGVWERGVGAGEWARAGVGVGQRAACRAAGFGGGLQHAHIANAPVQSLNRPPARHPHSLPRQRVRKLAHR